MIEFLKTPAVKLSLAILLIVGIVWWIWPRAMPPPAETLRQNHPLGFSIIVPPGYEVKIDQTVDDRRAGSITATDHSYRSFPPMLTVFMFRDGEAAQKRLSELKFSPASFQDRPAFFYNAPRGKQWLYRIVTEVNGKWFELGVALPEYADVPNHRWNEYLQSFRYTPPTPPATTPTN